MQFALFKYRNETIGVAGGNELPPPIKFPGYTSVGGTTKRSHSFVGNYKKETVALTLFLY